MGQASIIILTGAILITAFMQFGMQRDNIDSDKVLTEHQEKVMARNVANAGLNKAVRMLAAEHQMGSWSDGLNNDPFTEGDFDGGSYEIAFVIEDPSQPNATASGDTVDVIVNSRYGGGEHEIVARYARAESDMGIPPAFENAIASDLVFQENGNVHVFAISDSVNASVHTNEDLIINGNAFMIEGYGTYSGTVNNNIQDNFYPNVEYHDGENNYFHTDPIEIPSLNFENLQETAQQSGATINAVEFSIDGDATGTIDLRDPSDPFWAANNIDYVCSSGSCGTPENPFIMIVDGELDFSNMVQFEGYGTIVATGDVRVNAQGSGGGVYGSLNQKKETQVLLAAQGDIDVQGNACFGLGPAEVIGNDGNSYSNQHCESLDLDGSPTETHTHGISLYAEGGLNFGGTPYIVGGAVAKEAEIDFSGALMLTYASGSEETLGPGFQNIIPIGPILIAYGEY